MDDQEGAENCSTSVGVIGESAQVRYVHVRVHVYWVLTSLAFVSLNSFPLCFHFVIIWHVVYVHF